MSQQCMEQNKSGAFRNVPVMVLCNHSSPCRADEMFETAATDCCGWIIYISDQ